MGMFDFLKPKKSAEQEQLDNSIQELQKAAFPLGKVQIDAEANRLREEMNGRLTKDDCRMLVQRVKVMIILSEARDEARLADYVHRQVEGKLSREESRLTYLFIESLTAGRPAGGSGDSAADPVVIQAVNEMAGVRAEYDWLQKTYGPMNQAWTLVSQSVGQRGTRSIDTFDIRLKNGTERAVYFDVTSFFGQL